MGIRYEIYKENVSGYGIDVNDFKKLKAGGFLINKEGKGIRTFIPDGRKTGVERVDC